MPEQNSDPEVTLQDILNFMSRLYLVDNHIRILPETIGNLKSLKYLYLISNHLSAIPESLSNLSSLNILELQNQTHPTTHDKYSRIKNLGNIKRILESQGVTIRD